MLAEQIVNHHKFRTSNETICLLELSKEEFGTIIFRESRTYKDGLIMMAVINKVANRSYITYQHQNSNLAIMQLSIKKGELNTFIANSKELNRNVLDLIDAVRKSELSEEEIKIFFKNSGEFGNRYLNLFEVGEYLSSNEVNAPRYTSF